MYESKLERLKILNQQAWMVVTEGVAVLHARVDEFVSFLCRHYLSLTTFHELVVVIPYCVCVFVIG